MRVTKAFGITGPVEFVDVHIERDNFLFLDPSAIRNGKDALSTKASAALVTFFREVLSRRLSAVPTDHTIGLALLSELHEPNETRLGMSQVGLRGHAFGAGQSEALWEVLGHSREARAAVLTRLEHLPLFVDQVGPDLISDATTRVIFGVLADFTSAMMVQHPELATGSQAVDIRAFEASQKQWVSMTYTLPIADSRPLILIPRGWVYWRLLMNATPFYNRYATATVQAEKTQIAGDGSELKPSKARIKAENPNKRLLNGDQSIKYKEQENRDLVSEYQQFVDENFEPLTEADVARRT